MNELTKRILAIIFICICCFANDIIAQSKEELQQKKAKIQQDIVYKNKLLQETKRNKEQSVQQVILLQKKISSRERFIRAINREVVLLTKQITTSKDQIKQKEREIEDLKNEYAKMIYYAYKNRSAYDKLMFVFAAEDFNQAYKRLMYYQQYAKYREQQTELITKAQVELKEQIEQLKIQRAEKQSLLQQEQQERNNLTKERQEKQTVVNALQDDEKKLRAEIKKKKKEAVKLQKAIQKMIEEEIAREKAKGKEALTPEALELSNNFTANKAKLPWPVEKGEITGKFGKQSHPVLRGIEIQNNGIDINTTEGAMARAVFEGLVTKVMIIPGVGKVVMVRHGEYYTVYSNLKETFVQKGDKVTTKQELGTILTDSTKGLTEVHFEIWKKQTILNPVDWIYRAK